jgi:hypothetical protein
MPGSGCRMPGSGFLAKDTKNEPSKTIYQHHSEAARLLPYIWGIGGLLISICFLAKRSDAEPYVSPGLCKGEYIHIFGTAVQQNPRAFIRS